MNDKMPSAWHLVESHRIELSRPAAELLRAALLPGNWHPADYVEKLLQQDLLRDARHLLAHALPRRRALWWACLCARDVREFVAEDELAHVLDLAVDFVMTPTESTRRAAEQALHTVPLNSFTAQLAAAVFMSQGSLAPPEGTPVPVPPFVLGRLVSTVVYAAATKKNVVRYLHHMREYVELGREIAQGKHLWPQDAERPSYRLDAGPAPLPAAHIHWHEPLAEQVDSLRGGSGPYRSANSPPSPEGLADA